MSLVNDMLRDLEERRAAPAERLALEGLQAVDEAAAARREIQTKAPMRSSVGPKPMSSVSQDGPLSSRASITTPWRSSSASSPGSAKTGRRVSNSVEA